MELKGQTAIVTGGASGLGEATAAMLGAEGAEVVLFDIDTGRGETVAERLGAQFRHVDICSEEQVNSALAALNERGSRPRILVNCAGYGIARRVVDKNGAHPLEDFRRVIEVNLTGTFNCIRLFAANLIAGDAAGEENGVIIMTASVAAHEGQGGQAAYSASKGGIAALTLPLARDLARYGVRVCTISPGLFWTPPATQAPQKLVDSLKTLFQYPSRFGQPKEYASLAREICKNPMLNGSIVRLDGAVRLS